MSLFLFAHICMGWHFLAPCTHIARSTQTSRPTHSEEINIDCAIGFFPSSRFYFVNVTAIHIHIVVNWFTIHRISLCTCGHINDDASYWYDFVVDVLQIRQEHMKSTCTTFNHLFYLRCRRGSIVSKIVIPYCPNFCVYCVNVLCSSFLFYRTNLTHTRVIHTLAACLAKSNIFITLLSRTQLYIHT